MNYPRIILKPRKARPFYGRHPWVLDSAIDRVEGDRRPTATWSICSPTRAGSSPAASSTAASRIRVRLYTWDAGETLDEAFWRRRLEAAVGFRQQLGYDDPRGAARLVFSEGDGLSGLIVDRYGEYLAVQVTRLAMAVRLPQIVPMLVELTGTAGHHDPHRARRQPGRRARNRATGLYWGQMPDGPLLIVDHGLTLRGGSGRRAEDGLLSRSAGEPRCRRPLFSRPPRAWTCSATAAGSPWRPRPFGGAREVLGVDTSQRAVDAGLGERRAERDQKRALSVRRRLRDARVAGEAGERFGGVVLDPPKFARSRGAVDEALRAYHWLNRLARRLLEPGGILVTCSCSGHVTREDFFYMLVGVAQQTGREIQVLEQRGASPDHPVSATCPETEYLKCFICRVA